MAQRRAPWRYATLMRRSLAVAVALVVLLVGYVGATFVQVIVYSGHDNRGPKDAIVVLGTAQYDGRPSPAFARRLNHALELWQQGAAPLVITTGSKLPGDRFTEGFSGFRYLLGQGVPESALLLVSDGVSTWEQLAATARVLDARGLSSVIAVSDPYHSLRLAQIADEVGLSADLSPTAVEPTFRQLARETVAVSLGRVLGYRRVHNWLN